MNNQGETQQQLKFEKSDIIAALVIGEAIGLILLFLGRGISQLAGIVAYLPPVLPIVALVGLYAAYLIGRKIPVIYQFVKFGAVGVLNTVLDFGILNLLISIFKIYAGAGVAILNAVSFGVAVIHSYFWNKFWIFKKKETAGITGEFIQFLTVSVIGILINSGTIYLITTIIKPQFGISAILWVNLAKLIATVISLFWNFLGYKFIVFKKRNDAILSGTKNF